MPVVEPGHYVYEVGALTTGPQWHLFLCNYTTYMSRQCTPLQLKMQSCLSQWVDWTFHHTLTSASAWGPCRDSRFESK